MGFPHIGTVDTRHHHPGTSEIQASLGAGLGAWGIPGAVGTGAAISADTYATPQLSVASSGQLLYGLTEEDELTFGGRLGLRYRPSPKLSLGAGAFGGYSITPGWRSTPASDPVIVDPAWNYGADLEIATSRTRPKGRFASHAWRLSIGRSTRKEVTATLLGDWSRSIPTPNSKLRFSYGINYGFLLISDAVGLVTRLKTPSGEAQKESGPAYFVGAHLGFLWGLEP